MKKHSSTTRITRLAVLSALGVAVLFLSSLLPSARLALTAIAGIFTAIALIMYGLWWSIAVYAVTAVLSLLILPTKGCAIFYAAFLGLYPIAKALFEKHIPKVTICWIVKAAFFSLVFWVWWFIPAAVGVPVGLLSHWYVLWPLGIIVFAVYDICFSFLIKIYIERISGYFS